MITMPWKESTAPNVMLEITDACNVSCAFCYKKLHGRMRSLEDIRQDLDAATKLRPLHTVTLTGGEPTMHPQLAEIISMIKARDLHVFLLTNGMTFDQSTAKTLRQAGLDSILFHVDHGQKRKDLPQDVTFEDIRKRLDTLTDIAHSAGLDVSISYTLDQYSQLDQIVPYFMNRHELSFLFLAKGVDAAALHNCQCQHTSPLSTDAVIHYLDTHYGLAPYADIPAQDGGPPIWLSFFMPYMWDGTKVNGFRVKSNWLDVLLMRTYAACTGRYMHKTSQKPAITALRVFLNSISTLHLNQLWPILKASCSRHNVIRHKMIVYDDGPRINDLGEIVHCDYCPTAIVRKGKLLPCCTADFGDHGQAAIKPAIREEAITP